MTPSSPLRHYNYISTWTNKWVLDPSQGKIASTNLCISSHIPPSDPLGSARWSSPGQKVETQMLLNHLTPSIGVSQSRSVEMTMDESIIWPRRGGGGRGGGSSGGGGSCGYSSGSNAPTPCNYTEAKFFEVCCPFFVPRLDDRVLIWTTVRQQDLCVEDFCPRDISLARHRHYCQARCGKPDKCLLEDCVPVIDWT